MTRSYSLIILLLFAGCSNEPNKASSSETSKSNKKMSATYLKIIPTSPSFVPDKATQSHALCILNAIYDGKDIEMLTTDTIEFVDQGANFDSVNCNLCGKTVEISDWQDAMDKAYTKQFVDLTIVMPCCHKKNSLNDLKYNSSAGFAKFVISISDPEHQIEESDLKKLQQVLGTPLRVIWAHY